MTPVEIRNQLQFNSDFDNPVNVSRARRYVQLCRMVLSDGVEEHSHGSERFRFNRTYIRDEMNRAIAFIAANDSSVAKPEHVFANTERFRD